MMERGEVQAGAPGGKMSHPEELDPSSGFVQLHGPCSLTVPSSSLFHGKHLTDVPAVTTFRIGKGAWQD